MPDDGAPGTRRVLEPAPPGAGGWVRRLRPFLVAHRRKVAVALTGSIIGQVASATVPLLQKVIVDDVVVDGERPLAPWVGLLILAAAISFVATFVRRANGNSFGFAVQHDLRDALYRHVQRLDIGGDAQHDAADRSAMRRDLSTGEVISRSTADITLLQTLLSQLHVLLGNLILVVVSLAVIAWLSPLLTIPILVCLPALWLVARRLRWEIFPSVWNDQRLQAELASRVEENTTGARVVRAFGQQERELGRFVDGSTELFASRIRTARINSRFTPVLQLIPGLGQLAVLGFGGWLALRGSITVGTFLAFFSYLVQLVAPVRALSGALTTMEQARAGAERILEVLDSTPIVTEAPGALDLIVDGGGIELRGVSFGYRRGEPLLQDVDITVAPGETVAVVGPSGSGKSTLALLLARFHDPSAGTVSIDGQDVRSVTLSSLRRSVGTVFEEAFLFSGTIGGNIARGRPDATDADVEAAARSAGAHEFIAELPLQYRTPVAELGATLSGGQRQRLTIARALLTDPPILVLDDATSAVDTRTEASILDALRAAATGRTTVVVARRRSTILLADRVVLIEAGHVTGTGTHEQLLATSAAYRALIASADDPAGADELVGAVGPALDAERSATAAPGSVDPRAWPVGDLHGEPTLTGPRFTEQVGGGGQARQTMPTAAALSAAGDDVRTRVAALGPALDRPAVDLDHETHDRHPFGLRRFVRPYRRGLWVGLGLVLADTVTTLAGPALVRFGVDDGVVDGSRRALLATAIAFGSVQLVSWVVGRLVITHTSRTAERMLFALRVRIFAQLQRLSLDRFEREEAGRIMARATSDVESLSLLLQQGLLNAIVSITSCLGVLVILVAIEPQLAVAVGVVVPVLVVGTEWFRRSSARAYELSRERVASVYAGIQEGIAGARVTRALASEEHTADRFRRASDRYRDSRVASARLSAVYFPFLQFVAVVTKALVLWASVALVADGTIGVGVLVAFLLYLDQFFAPIQQLSQVFDQWLQAGTALSRITELLSEAPSTPLPTAPASLGRVRGDVRFEGVEFTYRTGSRPALENLTFHVPAGQFVAIVGRTGAGKSTIARLLARFSDPSRGRVLIDGVPLTDVDDVALRRQLGYVPQEPVLFADTIGANIAYGRPDAGPADIEAAARLVGAHEFIRRLPYGYRTVIAERGRSLSAGQRQLICLARALIVDPRVLILDEATAQLDQDAEERLQRSVDSTATGRTTIVIAHRMRTALRADRVVVLERGRIVEDGPPAQLLASDGAFADLWAADSRAAVTSTTAGPPAVLVTTPS